MRRRPYTIAGRIPVKFSGAGALFYVPYGPLHRQPRFPIPPTRKRGGRAGWGERRRPTHRPSVGPPPRSGEGWRLRRRRSGQVLPRFAGRIPTTVAGRTQGACDLRTTWGKRADFRQGVLGTLVRESAHIVASPSSDTTYRAADFSIPLSGVWRRPGSRTAQGDGFRVRPPMNGNDADVLDRRTRRVA